MTSILSPDAEAVSLHLASTRFQQGVDAGRWRVLEESWPTVTIAVAAAKRGSESSEYALRIDLTRYPHEAPTFEPWNAAEECRLAEHGRPKGDRAGHIFRSDWEEGRALYAPYDRVALTGHPNWVELYPRSVWHPSRDLTFALGHLWEALDDADYMAA